MVNSITTNIEDTEKYKNMKVRSQGNTFYYYCSQMKRNGPEKGKYQYQKRPRNSKKRHICLGYFHFSTLKSDTVLCSIVQTSHHEEVAPMYQLSDEDVTVINENAE